MIDPRPFRALHYDPAAVGDLAAVIAPPYDVIGPAELDRLYARSPYNVVRLILNREPDRYAAAAAALAEWRQKGVLVEDPEPAYYFYVQDFTARGRQLRRSGVLAAVRLEPFEAGNILPHERTFPSAKADRLQLMQATGANLSPIFGVYPHGPDALGPLRRHAEAMAPWIDVSEGGERHRVWRVSDPAICAEVTAALRPTAVFIADGHHRYETALTYRDQRRAAGDTNPDAAHEFLLMYLCPMDDAGLVILPTHRVWHGPLPADWQTRVGEHFEIALVPRAEVLTRLAAETRIGGLAVHRHDGTWVVRLRHQAVAALDRALAAMHPVVRHLDVSVLDNFLLGALLGIDCARAGQEGALRYTHDDAEALAAADRDPAVTAFLLRPPRMSEVEAACRARQTMPQKSTYFFPKLQTGLVFRLLNGHG